MRILHILLTVLFLTSCSQNFVFTNSTDNYDDYLQNESQKQDEKVQIESEVEKQTNVKYVKLGTKDFYIQESFFNYATPDFLNGEQQQLYLCALSLYPIFNGSPMLIGDYPLQDGSYPTLNEMGTETIEIEDLRYIRVFGRYSRWLDFKKMMLSFYTEEYFPVVSNNCIEHNGDTYILDSAAGTPFYYNPQKEPDTFELIKMNDSQIAFFRYQYFFEVDSESPVLCIKYVIEMEKVNDIWYVDLFKKDCEIEIN